MRLPSAPRAARAFVGLVFGLTALWVGSTASCGGESADRQVVLRDTDTIRRFSVPSALLSEFWGKPMSIEAGVVLPEEHRTEESLPVCYSVHGFGGSLAAAWRRGPELVGSMRRGQRPRMIHVFLQAQFERGHHVFADSANNGPWATALTEEFVPALEAEFGACGEPRGRFLTGHSSGGWSVLWLQVAHPDFWNGTWATAPDPIDFRDFTGVDIYAFDSVYRDPDGKQVQLVRGGDGWDQSLEEFVRAELRHGRVDGQYASFDAVFGPRGDDGEPRPLFDRQTGAIDRTIAEAWRSYDLSWRVDREWEALMPRLRGKLHVFVGTADTFRLDGAVRRFVERLGHERMREGGVEVVFVEGRDHRTLLEPHEYWPDGLSVQIHRAMGERFDG